MGNLANRMLQYMAARRLADLVPGAVITGVHLPEWGMQPADAAKHKPGTRILAITRTAQFDLMRLSVMLNDGTLQGVLIQDYLQDIRFYHEPSYYRRVFTPPAQAVHDLPAFSDEELVINIRAGEILAGVDHYPLVPVGFYQDIVEHTGLRPVLMGQLDAGPYLDRFRAVFPDARAIPSQGAVRDFQMIRSAAHVAPSVSTFSWLASWLSNARTIHLPLLGFFNPSQQLDVNLLVPEDLRWRHYLFPLSHGLPEAEALRFHDRVGKNWRMIPSEQVSYIVKNRPFIGRRAGLRIPTVDARWYLQEYPIAAAEISDGWYEDSQHHFEATGQARGYLPDVGFDEPATVYPELAFEGTNLALGRPASQSSIAEWSVGATVEHDAAGAINGSFAERYGFHTAEEYQPWWQVDLERQAALEGVVVFNRIDHPAIAARATPLRILLSDDGAAWTLVHETGADELIGGTDGNPLVWRPADRVVARFVRLQAARQTMLHLVEVEVFGAYSS
jgi:F5/8 type C domain-containing protein